MFYMKVDLDVLSEATRRLLLALLAIERELCVCEIEAALDAPQPLVSRHLAILRMAGWLEARREGRRMYYCLHSSLPPWAHRLLEAYTEGGVPTPELQNTRSRLHAFPARPPRLTYAAS